MGPRRGELATVVYSDRYFRYGLSLRARVSHAQGLIADESGAPAPLVRRSPGPKCRHAMPLLWTETRLAPRAGLLVDASARMVAVSPRYLPAPRPRRLGLRVLSVIAETLFEAGAVRDRPPRRLALSYRQSTLGVEPRLPSAGPRPRRPLSLSLSCGRMRPASPPRPQFALPDDAAQTYAQLQTPDSEAGTEDTERTESVYERVYGALAKEGSRVSAANVAPPADVDKAGAKWPQRKVLNTVMERFNNGARAPLAGALAREEPEAGQRATVRALLACSGLFYALAFVAFYLLSLP